MSRWNAEDYHRSSSQQAKWAAELLAKLALRGDERALDIGCGDGKVTAEIARLLPGGSVVGVDSSPEMIAFARRNFPRAAHATLDFVRADARDLRFHGEFDLVFSNATLHWVMDQPAVLRGVHRALKPGGRLLLQMGGRGNAADLVAVVDRVRAESRWRAYFTGFVFPWNFCGPEDYAAWMAAAGLRARRIELLPKDMAYQDREGLAAWFRTTWHPYTEPLPEARRAAFIAESLDRYFESHPPDPDGRTQYMAHRSPHGRAPLPA